MTISSSFNGVEVIGNYMWSNRYDGGSLVSTRGNITLFSVCSPALFPLGYLVRLRYGTMELDL